MTDCHAIAVSTAVTMRRNSYNSDIGLQLPFYEDSADRCIYPNYRRVLRMLFKDPPKSANSSDQQAHEVTGSSLPPAC